MKYALLFWFLMGMVWRANGQAYQTPIRTSWMEDASTTATITWDTSVASRGVVHYGLTTNYTHTTSDGGGVHQHMLTLRELTPGTRYYYQASSTEGYAAEGSFKTAPVGAAAPLHFIVHGDLQGAQTESWAQEVSDAIVLENPDWVLHMGDMAEDQFSGTGFETWETFFRICSRELARCSFMPDMGNHDQSSAGQSLSLLYRFFRLPEAYPGNGYYAYTAGGSRFIVLNSNLSPESQTNWLARELQTAANDTNITWIISHFHHPPYSWGERAGWEEGKIHWSPLFTQYEADFVLSGHSHNYQRTEPIRGVRYLVVGGGGARLYWYTNDMALAFATSCYHYASFHVTGDVLQVQGIRSDGLVFDCETVTHRRHVRVVPAFPQRGESATVFYDPRGSTLEDASSVYIHIGQDAFSNAFADAPMIRESASGLWTYSFTVPESASNRVAFVFHDHGNATTNWHNNYDCNWQALLGRVSLTPCSPVAGEPVTICYDADMGPLAGSIQMSVWITWNNGRFAPTGFVAMANTSGSRWKCTVTPPAYAENMTLWFFNGSSSDDDYRRNWTFPLSGVTAEAWPPAPYVAAGSPFVSDKPEGGDMNRIGDNFDFNRISPPVLPKDAIKGFADFGEIYFNADATNLYVGGTGISLSGTNNILLLFLGVDTLHDNAWNLWHKSGLPNSLDFLHNVRFNEPMDIAIVLGDQYGDGPDYPDFTYGGCNFGQGVYYIGTNCAVFVPMTSAKLSQFEGVGTNPCTRVKADNRAVMRWECAIPWVSLDASGPGAVSDLFVAGVAGSSSVEGNHRYLSRTYIGDIAWGEKDEYRQYAFNTLFIQPLRINLLHADLLGDGIPNAWRLEHFTTPDGPPADHDSDGDGADNGNEYVSGTDPVNAGSFFHAVPVMPTPDTSLILQWPSAPGRLYDVLYTTNPAEPFSPLAVGINAAGYTVNVDHVSVGYYRVNVRH